MNKEKIFFFIGTTAELIKVFPIMKELERRSKSYQLIASGQNKLDGDIIFRTEIRPVDIQLSDSDINQSVFSLFSWFFLTTVKSLFKLRTYFKGSNRDNTVLIVHGDTISTVMGALLGKFFRLKIIHIEAGLRSYNFFNPFPEEIDRMIVSKLADIHCCPNSWALKNVEKKSGLKVNTFQNTLLDSLNFALSIEKKSDLYNELSSKDFFIFVFHRQENLFNEELLKTIFAKVIEYSENNIQCLLIMHKPTEAALRKANMLEDIRVRTSIKITNRLSYFDFMDVLSMSKFIVTDGGSNQEESYYFGKPCLILRKTTERNEGVGENVVLSHLKMNKIDEFFANYKSYNREKVCLETSPSSLIVNAVLSD